MPTTFSRATQYSKILQELFQKTHKEDFKDTILLLGKNLFDIKSADIKNKSGISDLTDRSDLETKLTKLPDEEFESLKYFIETFDNLQIIKSDTQEYAEVDLDLLEKGFNNFNIISSLIDDMSKQ